MELCNYHFRPALRLRLFSNGLLAPSFLSNLSSNYIPFSVSLKPETSWLFYFFKYTPSGRELELQSVGLFRYQKLEMKIEKLFGIVPILAQDWFWSRSPLSVTGFPVLACTGIFPVTEKSTWIEYSWKSCQRRRLWICKNVSRKYHAYPIYLAADFSRGIAILLVHEESGNNAGWLGTWNLCPLRTEFDIFKMIFNQLSYRKFFESKFLNSSSILSNFWILPIRVSRSSLSRSANSSWSRACSRLDWSYPVRVCQIFTAWFSICLVNSQVLFSARSALYSSLRFRILLLRAIVPMSFQKWSWSDSCPIFG